MVARIAAGHAGNGNAGGAHDPMAEGSARNRSMYRQFQERAAAAASPNTRVTRVKYPRPQARSSFFFGAATSSTRTVSWRRGSGTTGSRAGVDVVTTAGGEGDSSITAEVVTVGVVGSTGGGDPTSGPGFVPVSTSGGDESAMGAQRLLRRRTIKATNRRTTRGTPTAVPTIAIDAGDQLDGGGT